METASSGHSNLSYKITSSENLDKLTKFGSVCLDI